MNLEITSPAFEHQQGIPDLYTCKGKDISPPLQWLEPPAGTQSFVLIMDDPDAPIGTWDHWVVFNMPAELRQLEEAISTLPPGTQQGCNSWRRNDYGGPCPPGGARHRYFFKLYALDTRLDFPNGVRKGKLEKAMQGHILAQGEMVGIYKP
ncbi:MAG: YbhB/YbcL family Raf kinase inhibitor-like protein [Anaerolineaceae bacterium]|nr:YbhB/YbcL family Raf kinase inhibitor-like protein [Anaerolineaceae bacterium]